MSERGRVALFMSSLTDFLMMASYRAMPVPLYVLLFLVSCGAAPPGWVELKLKIRQTYPDVTQLTIAEFIEAHQEKALIVDVREPAEYAVSHLENAVNLGGPEAIVSAFTRSGKQEIVLYCSVGYRSSRVASEIQDQLSAPVFNLEGSIFEWANQGHPLFKGSERVDRVHPYDPKWGKLLDQAYHP